MNAEEIYSDYHIWQSLLAKLTRKDIAVDDRNIPSAILFVYNCILKSTQKGRFFLCT